MIAWNGLYLLDNCAANKPAKSHSRQREGIVVKHRFAISSIKTRMVVLLSFVFLLITVGVSSFFYFNASNLVRSYILREAVIVAEQNGEAISQWLSSIEDEMFLFSQIPEIRGLNLERAQVLMETLINERPYYGGILLADLTGQALTVEGHVINIGQRDYFLGALAGKGVFYSEPMITQATDLATVMMARAIYDESNQVAGVLAFSVSLEQLQAIASQMTLGGFGHGWLVNQNRMVLGHPDSSYLGNSDLFQVEADLLPVVTDMLKGQTGVDTYQQNGSVRIISFAPISRTGWAIALEADEQDVMSALADMRKVAVLIVLLALAIGSILAYFLANSLSKPIIRLREGADKIAAGNLEEITSVSRNDEIGALALAFNQMVQNLRGVIQNVSRSAEQVLDTSNTLSAATEQTGASVEEVASNANQFASTVTSMNQTVIEATTATSRITTMASEGEKALAATTAKMDELVHSIEYLAEIVQSLEASSAQIELIVQTIFEITEQTNLLALNAAIEAARAGEQGRGFAVVSDEIRKLSEQSNSATQDIRNLITDIQTKTKQAADGVDKGVSDVGETARIVSDTANLLHTIIDSINEVSERIGAVRSDTQQIEIGGQEMAAATEEQSATVEEIASSAQGLTEMARELQSLISRFSITEKN
mgnify:CR=1 FL=1